MVGEGSVYHDWALQLAQFCAELDIVGLVPEDTEAKSFNDFVTEVDYLIDSRLLQLLVSLFDCPVLSEERNWDGVFPSVYWLVDPLDGTSNFISGLPFFSTSVALIVEERVTFGFVFNYVNKDFYYAILGFGAFKKACRMLPSHRKFPILIGASTGTLRDLSRDLGSNRNFLNLGNFRILGSQALQLCFVAEGALSASLSFEAKVWDDLAGCLILSEAGGVYRSVVLETEGIRNCFEGKLNLCSSALAYNLGSDVGSSLLEFFNG